MSDLSGPCGSVVTITAVMSHTTALFRFKVRVTEVPEMFTIGASVMSVGAERKLTKHEG